MFRVSLSLVLFAMFALAPVQADDAQPTKFWVFVGTYSGGKSQGIYRCELDLATGKLSQAKLAGKATNPSFLAIHPNKKFLYAVGEVDNVNGKKGGGVSAFAIESASGNLKPLNQQSSVGGGPCHLVVDKAGKNALVANYGGGSCAALPIHDDGTLGPATSFQQHKGGSVNKDRQEAPHAHSINLDAANHFAFVADLGLDEVLVYRFDPEKGSLTKNSLPSAMVAPGSGPRHFAFHPSGKFAYVISELANTVTAYRYDADSGTLSTLQTIGTLPKDFEGTSHTAEVQVHPSGKFLYGSNRGHNSIAVFAIDEKTGKLTAKGHQAAGINVPRNFGIDPTGKFLLVANQDGDSIVVFRIDENTGALKATGNKVNVPKPVCVKFLPKPTN